MPPPPLAADLARAVRDRVAGFRRVALEDGARAAVALVVLPDRFGRPCFLLTRRAAGLSRNAGQWALPGGRLDPGETAVETAVRELGEELGVAPAAVEPVGPLDDYPARSGFVITPVVLLGGGVGRLRPNPAEVAAAYRVPLAALAGEGVPILTTSGGVETVRFRIRGHLVNPPTAAILHQFAELVLHARATRVAHFAQPEFTWS